MTRSNAYDEHAAKQKSWLQIQTEQSEKKKKTDRMVDQWMQKFQAQADEMEMTIEELAKVGWMIYTNLILKISLILYHPCVKVIVVSA